MIELEWIYSSDTLLPFTSTTYAFVFFFFLFFFSFLLLLREFTSNNNVFKIYYLIDRNVLYIFCSNFIRTSALFAPMRYLDENNVAANRCRDTTPLLLCIYYTNIVFCFAYTLHLHMMHMIPLALPFVTAFHFIYPIWGNIESERKSEREENVIYCIYRNCIETNACRQWYLVVHSRNVIK